MPNYADDQALVDAIEQAEALLNVQVMSARLAGLSVVLTINDPLETGETTVNTFVMRPIRGTK